MIRVAFVLGGLNTHWMGGKNYYRSLISSLHLLPTRKLQPVVFVSSADRETAAEEFPGAECVSCSYFDKGSLDSLIWKLVGRTLQPGAIVLPRLLKKYDIDVLSHFGPLPRAIDIKTIAWIPDFQHVYLPQFFSRGEVANRDRAFKSFINDCHHVIVSSESALIDLEKFSSQSSHKASVLRFVPEIDFSRTFSSLDRLKKRYGFSEPFFYLPNQFWAHKNHMLVVQALALLKSKGIVASVVATGVRHDYRHPGFYSKLMAEVEALGLTDSFLTLGIVPYSDLLSLMRYAVAVINPSLFEGWSTTVEEAKALGRMVLLSDIPVHREQSPDNAAFFGTRDAVELADVMMRAMDRAGSNVAEIGSGPLQECHAAKRMAFAVKYQSIIEGVISVQ